MLEWDGVLTFPWGLVVLLAVWTWYAIRMDWSGQRLLFRWLGAAMLSLVLAAPWAIAVLREVGWDYIRALLDDQVVEAGAGELRNALVEGLEQLESAVVPEQDLSGVGVEGEDEGLRVLRTGPVDHPVQQGAVAEVDPVKGARGHDALGTSGEMGKTAVNVHCDQR